MANPEGSISARDRAFGGRLGLVGAAIAVLGVLLGVVATAVAAGTDSRGRGGPVGSPSVDALHTSATCAHEAALITVALDTEWVPADVDGDGATDRVATATDDDASQRCRAFVGVRLADGTIYSNVLAAPAVPPPGLPAQVIGVPDLGADGRADIVVDTHLMADGALAQLFTLTDEALERVHVPAFEDGNFVVEGGGVMEPRGAACTEDGSLVLSMALVDGGVYQVTRHIYPMLLDPLRLTGPRMSAAEVPADALADRFPEFARPHFAACGGEVGGS